MTDKEKKRLYDIQNVPVDENKLKERMTDKEKKHLYDIQNVPVDENKLKEDRRQAE